VETSGVPSFDRVRSFYRKSDYTEEATIKNFYDHGDDKVTFTKLLAG
jgi:hypothetical protein